MPIVASMMTQTHLLVASALLAKPGERLRNFAVVTGALVPDAAIYVLFGWSKFAAIPERIVWDQLYWQEPWQSWTAAGNSLPIYGLLLLIGLLLLRGVPALFRVGLFLFFLSLAAITHIAGDFFVHITDAHRHFWPLSNWKFVSSVSYWHPDHHGGVFSTIEAVAGLVLCVILFRRFHALWVRVLLALLALAYIAVPVYFTLVLGGT